MNPSGAWCTQHGAAVRVAVLLQPNAKHSAVLEVHGDALKIRLQALPVEGKANAALTVFVAGLLGVPKTAVTLAHGQTSRRKLLTVAHAGVMAEDVRRRLLDAIKPDA